MAVVKKHDREVTALSEECRCEGYFAFIRAAAQALFARGRAVARNVFETQGAANGFQR